MTAVDFRQLQAKNRRTTWLLLGATFLLLTVVSVTVAYTTVGGGPVSVLAVVVSMFLTWMAYRNSDGVALRATGARPADEKEYAQLHNVVEEVAIAAGIPKPRVYVVVDPAPNAFATGKDPEHAAVAATTGLLEKMNRDELQGVMAHEIAHVRNYDIRLMTVAVATAGAIAIISDLFWRMLFLGGSRSRRGNRNDGAGAIMLVGFVVVVVLAPIAAALLRSALSRKREGLADATAVEFTRHPEGLRRALEKLDADVTVVRRTSHATSHLWIESPDDHEKGHKGRKFNDMFNTHPPLRERIDLLRAMEGLRPYEGPSAELIADLERRSSEMSTANAMRTPPASWAEVAAAGSALAPGTHVVGLAATEAAATPAAGGATPAAPTGGTPAGWYPDPSRPRALRWWDGSTWTSHTHP
ncbi:MAG: M48 family metalloprotease [Acidimicrobiales bacterium]|nr:M48 family metalloprotease [Acidimicrobiales bacterium]